ncbi:MAG: hypothetical protein LC130_16650 [Bryobacterales bacterium]|nr:hypothetical protein [Bryobacterales bacterium]
MGTTVERVRGRVSAAILDKVNRLFRNDDAGIWVELLQNARRAKAGTIRVCIEEVDDVCKISVTDDGSGIGKFQDLLTLGDSDWNAEIRALEDPAGMGFFSLCHSEVEVQSGYRRTILAPDVFLGKRDAGVVEVPEYVSGTRIRFTRPSSKAHLIAALEHVAEFCPLTVTVDERVLPRHEFLEGAEYREWIEGVEIGIAPAFRWAWNCPDDNWNFHGARNRHPFICPDGWLTRDNRGRWVRTQLHVRFDVRNTSAVKLQLPDRRAIVEDDFLRSFQRKALAALYRFFSSQKQHVLAFKNWSEAKDLGIALSEAAPLLTTWHAPPRDEFLHHIFGEPETEFVQDASKVLLVEDDVSDPHTLDAALQSGASIEGALYQEHAAFAGYSWYDKLPRLCRTSVVIDGATSAEWKDAGGQRPQRIEIEVAIRQGGRPERTLHLPALIHVNSEAINEPTFTAVAGSPWDDNELPEPFPVADFLMWSTFSASDDFGECDSWETQREEYQELIERIVNEYFRGPREALLSLLRGAIPWEAHAYLDQLGICEIRLSRGQTRFDWDVSIDGDDRRFAGGFDAHLVADVNTGYLDETDLALLERPDCPTRFAVTDDSAGTFHWVSEDEQVFREEMERAEKFGLSERLRVIMSRLRTAKIPYVRFDADGGEIEGLDRSTDAREPDAREGTL